MGQLKLAVCLGGGIIVQMLTGSSAMAVQLDRGPLVLTFSEEFTGDGLDIYHPVHRPTGKWKTKYDHGDQKGASSRILNDELQVYSDLEFNEVDPFAIADGVLSIRASKLQRLADPRNKDRQFASGLITSSPSFHQAYGYFEMRARLPIGDGLWPAFWLLAPYHPDITAPQYPGEIDVVELLGRDASTIYCSVHWPTRPDFGEKKSTTLSVRSQAGSWRSYGVLWTKQHLVWYVDDAEVARTPNPGLHRPMYILVNLAIGGSWGGPPSSKTIFPADFKIDYIRAYRGAD